MKLSHHSIRYILAITATLMMAFGCTLSRAEEGKKSAPSSSAEELAKQWGIQIAGLHVSAAGYMVDFRYKVLDPEKAAPLAKRDVKPYMIDQATGAKMLVPSSPKIGSIRQTAVKLIPGRVYGAMFANPVQTVKAGSKVTVVIGECRLENLTVE
ncbi:MAG TPA: hypothetical protein VEC99_05455 [Clostridia bacterium]|nr:hypothetical protein [Clostridia bacterium]